MKSSGTTINLAKLNQRFRAGDIVWDSDMSFILSDCGEHPFNLNYRDWTDHLRLTTLSDKGEDSVTLMNNVFEHLVFVYKMVDGSIVPDRVEYKNDTTLKHEAQEWWSNFTNLKESVGIKSFFGDGDFNKPAREEDEERWHLIQEKKSKFEALKDNKVQLTDEEKSEVRKRKAVWHMNIGRSKYETQLAVWKSVDPKTDKTTYITHTHRAYNTAPTLKGAIGKFHRFIKSTA